MTSQSHDQGLSADQQSGRSSITSDDIMSLIKGWMNSRNLGDPSENATFDDSGFDSLDSVELAFYLEDEFGIEIDVYNHPTFGALVRYVQKRL